MSNVSCSLVSIESDKHFVSLSFFWIKPIALLFDYIGHILSFIVFYKQSKKNKIYSFQLYEAIAKANVTLSTSYKTIVNNWLAGLGGELGQIWFQKDYFRMWFAAHFPIALDDMATSVALFLSLATSIDRGYAIAKPAKYRQINRKHWEMTWIISSLLMGIVPSIFVLFLNTVTMDPSTGLYRIISNTGVQSNVLVITSVYFRNIIWIIGVVTVASSGIRMCYLFRKQKNRVAAMMEHSRSKETIKQQERHKVEKILFILTIYTIVQSTTQVTIMIIHTILSFRPGFINCQGPIYSAMRNAVTSILNSSDFYFMLIISKQFRKIVRESLERKGNVIHS